MDIALLLSAIRAIHRAVNRLGNGENAGLLKKLATDLLQAYEAEISFQKMNRHSGKTVQPGPGFFKSLDVLKEEFMKALEKADK